MLNLEEQMQIADVFLPPLHSVGFCVSGFWRVLEAFNVYFSLTFSEFSGRGFSFRSSFGVSRIILGRIWDGSCVFRSVCPLAQCGGWSGSSGHSYFVQKA